MPRPGWAALKRPVQSCMAHHTKVLCGPGLSSFPSRAAKPALRKIHGNLMSVDKNYKTENGIKCEAKEIDIKAMASAKITVRGIDLSVKGGVDFSLFLGVKLSVFVGMAFKLSYSLLNYNYIQFKGYVVSNIVSDDDVHFEALKASYAQIVDENDVIVNDVNDAILKEQTIAKINEFADHKTATTQSLTQITQDNNLITNTLADITASKNNIYTKYNELIAKKNEINAKLTSINTTMQSIINSKKSVSASKNEIADIENSPSPSKKFI